jgi:hypothetical protein
MENSDVKMLKKLEYEISTINTIYSEQALYQKLTQEVI